MSRVEAQSDLIFDLGMHKAMDTAFYLRKGFRVVALEANPVLATEAASRFAGEISRARLTIVDRALWEAADKEISFFVNPVKDDWSSAFQDWAEKGGRFQSDKSTDDHPGANV